MPTVSIITVVYNGAATLEQTIRSVETQTFMDREYIIVDGGSRDGTLEIIKKYADRVDSSWVSEPDKGIYDAMNKGIRMARGEWLFFLGSDDTFLNDGVLTDFFATDLQGIDLAYGDVYSKDFKGRYDGEFTLEKLLSRNLSHQAAFYRRSLFHRLGDYDLRYRGHADWEFNLRCFSDPGVRTKYTGVLTASFGVGGISASHDKPFLREKLLPAKLRWLNNNPGHPLRKIGCYDEWWRFLRNAGITGPPDLKSDEPLPPALRQMIRQQRPFPPALLRFGPFSKGCMLLSYLEARMAGRL